MERFLQEGVIPVGELLLFVKGFFQKESFFHSLSLKGEVGKVTRWKGAYFFDLKDDKGFLPCSWWLGEYASPSYIPVTGDEVLVEGDLSLYEKRGSLSFRVRSLTPFGEGAKLLAIKQLKEKLEKEGLFASERKKKVPTAAEKIGIVCGQNSAAESDLRRNISRRWPLAKMCFAYASVQGKSAPKEIITSLKELDEQNLDVLILARGGGSDEDLMAFNDEELARVIANLKTPLVTAIGHEIDTSIADLVSDLRVSTPTAAAETVTLDIEDVLLEVKELQERLFSAFSRIYFEKRKVLDLYQSRPIFKKPNGLLEEIEKKKDTLKERFILAIKHYFVRQTSLLEERKTKLFSIAPERVLERGFSITLNEKGKPVRLAKDITVGGTLQTILKEGRVFSKVEEIKDE